MKKLLCYLLGHDWTSKSLKNLPFDTAVGNTPVEKFKDHCKMYCDRCNKISELNNRLKNL